MPHRPRMSDLKVEERQELVQHMLAYLTDAVVAETLRMWQVGTDRLATNRTLIARMETFLTGRLSYPLRQLPFWKPENPIPPEFGVVRPRDDGTPRPPLLNLNPSLPRPAAFAYPAVGAYATAADLAAAIETWTSNVQTAVGGAMATLVDAPAAPIFWCWQAMIDHIFYDWEFTATHVPPCTGVPIGLAVERLRAAGLDVEAADQKLIAARSVAGVVAQWPLAGTAVARGTAVRLTAVE